MPSCLIKTFFHAKIERKSLKTLKICVLSCFLVCSLQPCGHLLGKGLSLGSLVSDVFLCFCHFPMWCPVLGVVLNCIDS